MKIYDHKILYSKERDLNIGIGYKILRIGNWCNDDIEIFNKPGLFLIKDLRFDCPHIQNGYIDLAESFKKIREAAKAATDFNLDESETSA